MLAGLSGWLYYIPLASMVNGVNYLIEVIFQSVTLTKHWFVCIISECSLLWICRASRDRLFKRDMIWEFATWAPYTWRSNPAGDIHPHSHSRGFLAMMCLLLCFLFWFKREFWWVLYMTRMFVGSMAFYLFLLLLRNGIFFSCFEYVLDGALYCLRYICIGCFIILIYNYSVAK